MRKTEVVFLKIRGGDVGVGGVQVIQDGTGGGDFVSDVLVSEVADAILSMAVGMVIRD